MNPIVKQMPLAIALLPLVAHAQDARPAASERRSADSAVVRKLRDDASRLDTAPLSHLFSALSAAKGGVEPPATTQQRDLAGRLEKLTRDVIRAWLLRDLDTSPLPPLEVLEQRLSGQGERLRTRIVSHAEALALQGILTPRQARAWLEKTGRKAEPLLRGRFGPQTVWIPPDDLGVEDLAGQLRQRVGAYSWSRAGFVFRAILGGRELEQFLDPKTRRVPPNLVNFAGRFMPNVELSPKESDLTERLNALTLDIFCAWLTRGLDKTPLPSRDTLKQRLVEYQRLEASLFAHAEAVALEAILTPEQADRCLCAVWRGQGMRALLDPALANRLRLSRWQQEEIHTLLEEKNSISDSQTEAQAPLVGLTQSRPDLRALDEQIAKDARARLDQVDGLIWDCLYPGQIKALSRIMDGEKRQAPRPAPRRKRPAREG